MKVNTDLHLHSKYSMASSRKMELPTIAREASKKGMELIGTADCTHPKWLEEIKRVSVSDDYYLINVLLATIDWNKKIFLTYFIKLGEIWNIKTDKLKLILQRFDFRKTND